MAIVTVPYQPQLTPQAALDVVRKRFRGRYEISKASRKKCHFDVKKNWTTAVSVGLQQEPDTATKFVVTAAGSSPVYGVLLAVQVVTISLFWKYLGNLDVIVLAVVAVAVEMGLDRALFGGGRKALEGEVVTFIQNAPEFRGTLPGVTGALAFVAQVGQPVLCASCSTPLAGQAQFCHVCGTPASSPGPQPQPSCAACGEPLSENAQFCHTCRAAALVPKPEETPAQAGQVYCSECGTAITASSRFCHGCGAEVATLKGENAQAIVPADSLTPEAPVGQGYCAVCGLDLGVNEKLRGLAAHETCATPAFEASADTPANH
jgi:hypothetical protein